MGRGLQVTLQLSGSHVLSMDTMDPPTSLVGGIPHSGVLGCSGQLHEVCTDGTRAWICLLCIAAVSTII